MNISNLQSRSLTNKNCRHGFASILTVITVGIGLLLILLSMYDDTVESQNTQKDHMMRADYQQREEAFLRAMTNIIPNKAMLCMQDGSHASSKRGQVRWNQIYNEALILSNSREAISTSRAEALELDGLRSGNSSDSNIGHSAVVVPGYGNSGYDMAAGINITASTSYPPPLKVTYQTNRNRYYPVVSIEKKYDSSASGWVGADTALYPLYNLVDAPSLHFNYQTGSKMIAKHNWWTFKLSMADNDEDTTQLSTRTKQFLVSLYEIPSQLSINSASYTTLGTHTDGTAWENINITGGVFAQKVKTEGSFSVDAISSRKGVELSGSTTVNGSSLESNPFANNDREESQSKGETFPISSASNGGRVAFIPINRGLDFYDRFAGDNRELGNGNGHRPTNAVSSTNWDYYSIGAQQCIMRLDIIDVISDTDQTPTSIRFTYANNADGSSLVQETFTKGDNWPNTGTTDGDLFPFHVATSATGTTCLAFYTNRLIPFLTTRSANFPAINHSISINPDYVNNPDIQKPSFPAEDTDIGLLLLDSSDMTDYTKGFSLVTNLRMIIADDVNVTASSTLDTGDSIYPPLSLFAPEKRYGDSTEAMEIEIAGQLGALTQSDDSPVRIGDLKSGASDEVIADNISADLKPITHPSELPPINMMNWMVVIREIHPTYVPIVTDDEE